MLILSACSTGYYIVHTSTWQRVYKKITIPHPVQEYSPSAVEEWYQSNYTTSRGSESTRPQEGNFAKTKWIQEMEHSQRCRKNVTDQVCLKHRIFQQSVDAFLSFRGNRGTLFANDQHKVIFSKIHKVASNHFTKLWKTLGGLKHLYKESRDLCVGRVERYYKVIFVRHPLSRILSAYRDKFERHNYETFRKIAEGIKRRQRVKFPKAAKNTSSLAFEEFIHYLVNANKNRENSHWNLISSSARVCELRYHFIGKLESLDNDLQYLLHKLRANTSLTILRAYQGYSGEVEILRHYYGNISRPLLRRLYQAYKMDFDMFGYDMTILGSKVWPTH